MEIGNGEHSVLEGASKSQVLKEVFSLTDVIHCKNRQLQAIQWVPQRKVQFCTLTSSGSRSLHQSQA
jgi:hypothetical protein